MGVETCFFSISTTSPSSDKLISMISSRGPRPMVLLGITTSAFFRVDRRFRAVEGAGRSEAEVGPFS
jgi:hypothetical protein